MFSALAGMYMAAKVHFEQTKANIYKNNDKQVSEMLYRNKIDKADETEKFSKSRMPESGYMTLEEYEAKSRPLSKREISSEILDKAQLPKDKNFVYIPQKEFTLVKYNNPVGSPELSLPRRLQFDRQVNAQGIVSGDFTKLVYPSVYYYAEADCVSCDLFLINLDTEMSEIDRVKKANVVNKEPNPLLSTQKDISNKFVFRTLTPIDFSVDNTKLIVKEKIGYKHDGIWETNLWVYDFSNHCAKNLSAIREAIIYYWQTAENINLNENRWDIYPLGFDANNSDHVIVNAYAYTGSVPKFLGSWSIDIKNNSTKPVSMSDVGMPISVVGYRLAEEQDIKSISELEFEAKQAKKEENVKQKQEKADKKMETTLKRIEYQRKIHQMDMDTLFKIKERQNYLKNLKKNSNGGITNNVGESSLENE